MAGRAPCTRLTRVEWFVLASWIVRLGIANQEQTEPPYGRCIFTPYTPHDTHDLIERIFTKGTVEYPLSISDACTSFIPRDMF